VVVPVNADALSFPINDPPEKSIAGERASGGLIIDDSNGVGTKRSVPCEKVSVGAAVVTAADGSGDNVSDIKFKIDHTLSYFII